MSAEVWIKQPANRICPINLGAEFAGPFSESVSSKHL